MRHDWAPPIRGEQIGCRPALTTPLAGKCSSFFINTTVQAAPTGAFKEMECPQERNQTAKELADYHKKAENLQCLLSSVLFFINAGK